MPCLPPALSLMKVLQDCQNNLGAPGRESNLHPLGLESNARPVELPTLRGTEGIRTPNLRFRRPLL